MRRRLALGALIVLGLAAHGPAAEDPADVLVLGRIWTAEGAQPWAEAVAVREGRIAFVGTRADALTRRGGRTRLVDAGGRLVLPAFIDAHIHLMGGALTLERVDLIEDDTLEGVQARIRAFAASRPQSAWVLGRGWLYGAFPGGLPTKEQLDAAVADRPAYMECYDGHSGWANSKALALAGITRDTKDPENGVIVRDPRTGEPTGALKEAANGLVEKVIPPATAEQRYELLLRALRQLNEQGIAAVHDAGGGIGEEEANLALYERAQREGRLTVRLTNSVVMQADNAAGQIALARKITAAPRGPFIRYGAVKGYVDGVVEAKTAAMLDPYPGGAKDDRGLPNWEPAALNEAVVAASAAGLQVFLHAIGDRGVRMALDAHEVARRAHPGDRRGRIEHIETISPADDARFAALGVIASMQPLHANPDKNNEEVWQRNAGPVRASRGWPWRSLERAGARLAYGSDWPVMTSDVMRGIYCATARRTREGRPPGGWLPEQAVTLESALRHYTIDAAYAAFDEAEGGSLRAGKRADLVVLSTDPFGQPAETILKTKPVLTMVDGRVVFESGELPRPTP